MGHNLAPGFYLVRHTTGEVVAGPFSTRNTLLSSDFRGSGPCCILEVVGDILPWLCGEPVGTEPVCDEDGTFTVPEYPGEGVDTWTEDCDAEPAPDAG